MSPVAQGGEHAVRTLADLGADTVFGLPGQHALALFDALRTSSIRYVGARTEQSAAFAADGYARTRRDRPGVCFVSTGPGALLSLAALQESAAAAVPVVCIASQVPVAGVRGANKGYLHELDNQAATAAGVVKHAVTVTALEQIPDAIAAAWGMALSAPAGPCWVEIPQDILESTGAAAISDARVSVPTTPVLDAGSLDAAAALLSAASRPMIIAGGGVQRSRGEAELATLARRLRAPVVQTFGAKGVYPWDDPLSLQSWLEDRYLTEFLESADVVLVAGSRLGDLTTNYRTFRPQGHLIHIDANAARIGANYRSLAIHADCREALGRLAATVPARAVDGLAEAAVADVLGRIHQRLDDQPLALEQRLIAIIRRAVPEGTPNFWDSTILGYWAWSAWPESHSGAMHSGQGAGGLGFALPAAVGACVASDGPVLAVTGDGGAMYNLADLNVIRQQNLPVTWLIVDDGGYGILREYMSERFAATFGTDLGGIDFVGIARSFGIEAEHCTVDGLESQLGEALACARPRVLVLKTALQMFAPTHVNTTNRPDDPGAPLG